MATISNRRRRRCRPALALLGFLAVAGCSDEPAKGRVTGTVSVDGSVPPEGSSINFVPVGGGAATAGGAVENGNYSVDVPVGNARVEIRVPRPKGGKGKLPAKATAGPSSAGTYVEESLPPEYNEKSTLTFDVKAGRNEKNWELKAKK